MAAVKEVKAMEAQNERDEESINEILHHWDNEDWPPRMSAEKYIMRRSGSRR